MAVRRPQPRMEPTPHAVSANAPTITMPSKTRLVSIRGLGPPRMPPATATPTDTEAASVRVRTLRMRETSQPTVAATGSTSTSSAKTNHSVRVGCRRCRSCACR